MTSSDVSDYNLQQDDLGYSPQKLLQVLLSPVYYPVGAQVRLEDVAMGTSKIMNLLKFLRNETFFAAPFKQIPIIFLVSDTVSIRREALLRWKLPVACLQSSDNKCQNCITATISISYGYF